MELFVLDDNFNALYNIDIFESLIWTRCYNGYGKFEFYTPVNTFILEVISVIQNKIEEKLDCYMWSKDSDSYMIIEDLEITTDVESRNHLIVSGRSLESILERRIIWDQTLLDGFLQDGIKKLIDESIMNPKILDRKIPNFLFLESDEEYIRSLKIRAQYTGNNLYDTIVAICDTFQLGFNIVLDSNNNFVFSLIHGKDHTYDQSKNPYVIFSPTYENVINSDYLESAKTLKNVTLVAGEGEGNERTKLIVGEGIGLKRRELYTDARDLQSKNYSETIETNKASLDEYKQILSEDEKSLSEITEDYNKRKIEYEDEKSSYEIRIANFKTRVNYYEQQITNYTNGLTSEQKTVLSSRNNYKKMSDQYDDLSTACSDKISDYNSKLNTKKSISYEEIVEYEDAIKLEESKKSEYDEKKRELDTSKSEEEKKLPNYETTLSIFESMISKYQGIISNDQQSLDDETKTFNNETTEYEKQKNSYEDDMNRYRIKIKELEDAIANDTVLLNDFYDSLLEQRGKEKLSEYTYTKAFTGEIEALKTFVYGEDFLIGDIVQFVNEYDMVSKVLVSEIVTSQDTDGYSMYPTFKVME